MVALLFLVSAFGAAAVIFSLYRFLLPRPIKGIPYNEESSRSILGDLPSFANWVESTQNVFDWFVPYFHRHNSPIIQAFIQPFEKPWVIVSDAVEAEDILLRRNDDFEKSEILMQYFKEVVPNHHIAMQTNAEFKRHRQLIQDLMTPKFLRSNTAPQLHACFSNLVRLWGIKADLAQGRPFKVRQDIYNCALDVTLTAFFGLESPVNQTRRDIEAFSAFDSSHTKPDPNGSASFPMTPRDPGFDAMHQVNAAVELAVKSAFPSWVGWWHRLSSEWKKNYVVREQMFTDEINKRLNADGTLRDSEVLCGLDAVLRRENNAADRAGRKPDYHSRTMRDEGIGFVVGGSDTTHATIAWSLKLLAKHQLIQSQLRDALRSVFQAAIAEKRDPTASEITSAHIPFLDACEEELIRHAKTEPGTSRSTARECTILGHRIPKGTEVLLLGLGPSFFTPAFSVPDSLRSPTALAAKSKTGAWDPKDIAEFKPERWLTTGSDGKTVFNPSAGPHLTFGGGIRGCWGKRMGYMAVKIALVLILWNFELLEVPEELAGMEVIDGMSRTPQQCYVKFKKVQS